MKKNRRLKKYFPVKDDFNNFREPCQVCGGSPVHPEMWLCWKCATD